MLVTPEKNLTAVRFLLIFAALIVVIAGLKASVALLVPFLLSGFIAVISAPPLFWLTARKVPQWLALIIVLCAIICVGIAIAALVGTSVDNFSQSIPIYQDRLQIELNKLLLLLNKWGLEISTEVFTQYINPAVVMQFVANTLSKFGGVLTNSFLILLTVTFMLTEASSFPKKLQRITRNPEASLAYFDRFIDTVKRYMAIKTTMSFLTAALVWLWLTILGVDYPLLWGMTAFLLNFVPNIGSIIAAVPAVLLTTLQLGPSYAMLTAAGYLVVNTVVGNIIEPRYMGKGLGLSSLVVFLSLVFWGWVLGPVGMLLSVPLTMTVKIALETRRETQWLAILLGPEDEELIQPVNRTDDDKSAVIEKVT